jgi:ABC-type Mn2+/Zn2+ transport system ATPase subunit
MLLLPKIHKSLQNQITIQVTNAGKKFGREWIFRKVNLEIKSTEKVVILGLNGSGKSTLLQAMTGYLTLNEGSVAPTPTINKKQKTSSNTNSLV